MEVSNNGSEEKGEEDRQEVQEEEITTDLAWEERSNASLFSFSSTMKVDGYIRRDGYINVFR